MMQSLPTDSTPLTEAALAYASLGFAVLPVWGVAMVDGLPRCGCKRADCDTIGKHPVERAWQRRASSDVDTVRDARRRHPEANVGLAMGGEGRLVAVDIDGPAGRASWATIEAEHGPAPETLTSVSGRPDGGEHRIYRVPVHQDMKRLGNRASFRHQGIDTRVDGGQIVVAPSRHASGARYRWSVEAPVAEMPSWLFEALAGTPEISRPTPRPVLPAPSSSAPVSGAEAYIQAALRNAVDRIAGCTKGGRNSLLFAKSTTVFEYHVGAGLDVAAARQALEAAGLACGLPAAEVRETLGKAWAQAQKSPRQVPEGSPPAPPSSSAGAAGDDDENAWQSTLKRGKHGIENTFGNACKILRHAPEWRGRLSYNRMRVAPFLDGQAMRDADFSRIREDIEQRWGIAPSRDTALQAVGLVAEEKPFHPVQDYLNGLGWDRTGRIDRVAADILGVEPTPLTVRMLRCFFVSAVARALDPGCKVDSALVFRGKTGIRKSTFFRVLGGEWFSDSYADVRSKDGVLQVHAAWIYEWAEIDRVTTKVGSSDVKAFITVSRDDVRPPYGTGVQNLPRSGVIVGTTNRPFLDDETGSRRFHPVWVERMDEPTLRAWRDQLWAEAVHLYRTGEQWWLTDDEERERELVADEHTVENTWLEKVATYLESPTRKTVGVSTADVLVGALGVDLAKVTRWEESRVGKALHSLGWEVTRVRRNGTRIRIYRPVQTEIRANHQPRLDQVGPPNSKQNHSPVQPVQPVQHDHTHMRENNSDLRDESYGSVGSPPELDRLAHLIEPIETVKELVGQPTFEVGPGVGPLGQAPDPDSFGAWVASQGIDPNRSEGT